ncbi:family 10 glycosylhydrolase [Paenibacillus sp. GCM10027626]|uniref:family 10 glycosylhydrolase n=1 Tax=Paenibacillus sp. GCM10027626 TaxID=3273411 RepID=UPI003636E828
MKISLRRWTLLLFICALLLPAYSTAGAAGEGKNGEQQPFSTEIIVRTVNQFVSASDVVQFMNMAQANDVAVINLNVKQDEDDEVPSGSVFYQSAIAPIAPGYENFDALAAVIAEAHARGIKVRAWIPQFHDQAAALKDPDWQMQALVNGAVVPFTGSGNSEYFVNPLHPGVQAYQRSIINEVVANYDVDGVVLDWLRFDNYNMDMSTFTRTKYMTAYGIDPLNIDLETDNAARRQWNKWRTEQIGQYVHDVRTGMKQIKPVAELGVYILPPEFVEVGQDVAKFKDDVDFIAPMAYFDDWDFDPEWVYEQDGILGQTRAKLGPQAAIIPTLDDDWLDEEYQEVYGGIKEQFPDVTHLSFFVYGKWEEEQLQVIKARRNWPTNDEPQPDHTADAAAVLPGQWQGTIFRNSTGSSSYQNSTGTFTIRSSESDIWGRADSFYYVSRPLQGDGTIVARVKEISNAGEWVKAGVMIRESLSSYAKHVDMLLTPDPDNGAGFQYREQEKRNTQIEMFEGVKVPKWLKLKRSGNLFTGYWSGNGQNWTKAWEVELAMDENVHIGLAFSNPKDNENGRAKFDRVTVTAN